MNLPFLMQPFLVVHHLTVWTITTILMEMIAMETKIFHALILPHPAFTMHQSQTRVTMQLELLLYRPRDHLLQVIKDLHGSPGDLAWIRVYQHVLETSMAKITRLQIYSKMLIEISTGIDFSDKIRVAPMMVHSSLVMSLSPDQALVK